MMTAKNYNAIENINKRLEAEDNYYKILDFYWKLTKKEDTKMSKVFMKKVRLQRIAEEYERRENSNKVQKNEIGRRRDLKEKSYNNDMGKLNIVSGNILDNKDLIVNSANKYMICGSGVCGAIYKMANKELLEDYCKKHYKENMRTYEIRFSPGFDLGIDILHIYCPKYYDYKDHNEAIEDLLFCYYKIMLDAKNNLYKSIISVSLGTGIHGYKHNDIAKQVIDRLDYLVKRYDIDFTLVLPNEDIKRIYI